MGAIVQTLVTSFLRFFDFLRFLWGVFVGWIEAVWSASVLVIDAVLAALSQIMIFFLQAVTDVLLFLLGLAFSILPTMPAPVPNSGSLDLTVVNRYLPFAEIAALTGIWVVVFGAIGAYKLAKIVRGGG